MSDRLRFSKKFTFAQAINKIHSEGFNRLILVNDKLVSIDEQLHAIRLNGAEELVLITVVQPSLWDRPAVIEYAPGKFKEVERTATIYVKFANLPGMAAVAFKDRLTS